VYLLFVLIEAVQLALFSIVTDGRVSTRGVGFMSLLLLWLAFGSPVARGFLIVANAIPLLALPAAVLGSSTGSGSGHVLWVNVAIMFLTGVLLEATLLSSAMRRHLRDGRPRRGEPSTPALH
jgi:hypothetical protein